MALVSPMPWQPPVIDAACTALSRKCSFLDGSDTGIGKSYSTCFAAVRLNVRLGVVCPMSVIPSWIEAAERTGARLAFVGNIESLKTGADGWLRRRGAHQWQWNIPSDVRLVFDEVHRYKHSTTQNGKILRDAPRPVIMLSGTPFSGPHEARAIGHQLGLFHWDDFDSWAGQNGCRYGNFGGVEFVGINRVPRGAPDPTPAQIEAAKAEILDRIHRQIHHTGRGIRVRKSDLGDLFPAIRRETRLLPTENAEILDAAYLEELEQLQAEAVNGGVEFLRARQISEFSKLPHVIDMIEDLQSTGRSVLVFVNFRDSLERLRKHFEDQRPAMIYGGQDEEGIPREGERLRFQRDETQLWLAMIQAGGIGISGHDLNGRYPRSSLILPGVSAEQVIQADGRDHRAGGLTPVDHYFLFSDCAVERQIRRRLDEKINNITTLLDGDLTPRV
mgnify:CR=1 FL=1